MNHRRIKIHHISSFILLLICYQNSKAQERQVLDGKILTDSISKISGVHVINLSAEKGTTTNNNGKFRILAKPGDTLFFSSIQLDHKKVVVKESSFKDVLIVKMREKFNELDEVQLDNIKLSGVLSKDITRMPKSIYEKMGIPFPKPRRTSLELSIQSATAGGPLISILNTLNGTIKQLEKANENNERSILVNKGLNLVGKSFFISQMKINENEIINFLFFCVDDPEYTEFVKKESVLKLIEFFDTKIDSFKELRELD